MKTHKQARQHRECTVREVRTYLLQSLDVFRTNQSKQHLPCNNQNRPHTQAAGCCHELTRKSRSTNQPQIQRKMATRKLTNTRKHMEHTQKHTHIHTTPQSHAHEHRDTTRTNSQTSLKDETRTNCMHWHRQTRRHTEQHKHRRTRTKAQKISGTYS